MGVVVKGKKGGICNRTACKKSEAFYYNRETQAYYCQLCAFKINASHRQHLVNKEPLCTISEEDKKLRAEQRRKRYET